MGTGKQYDEEFKKQAIKLAKEIGTKAAADELCIPKGTLGTWVQKARIGEIDTGAGSRTPGESLTIAQQLQAANKRIKELEKKNRELEELNEFLEEASAFFAANRRKSGKKMRASLCCHTLENANKSYPDIKGCIIHSDRGSQYTSEEYRAAVKKYGIIQSMNSAGGRCHDNARCESMWARMKEELFYSREDKPENYTMKELKTMIWRYYMSYWANRRICTANGGLPPAARRKLYYDHIFLVA